MLDVLPAAPSEPVTDSGLWRSFTGLARLLVEVVAWIVGAVDAITTMEFLRLFVSDARVDTLGDSPQGSSAGKDTPESRLRFLMISVFRERGSNDTVDL